eukprot:5470427-Pleurochrysis_carterae.AAC.1
MQLWALTAFRSPPFVLLSSLPLLTSSHSSTELSDLISLVRSPQLAYPRSATPAPAKADRFAFPLTSRPPQVNCFKYSSLTSLPSGASGARARNPQPQTPARQPLDSSARPSFS